MYSILKNATNDIHTTLYPTSAMSMVEFETVLSTYSIPKLYFSLHSKIIQIEWIKIIYTSISDRYRFAVKLVDSVHTHIIFRAKYTHFVSKQIIKELLFYLFYDNIFTL